MINFDEFVRELESSGYDYDLSKIGKAYRYAEKAHTGQKRRSGEAYVTHPLSVAQLLIGIGLDTDCIAAALLHDVVEDTASEEEDIKREFGEEVAELVSGVTKLGNIPYSSKEEAQIENLRKMFLATAKDIRVIIIKLADRLHNMRTLESMPDEKRREKSLETMEVYAPIAHRLGMQRWKSELEDTALRYLDPIGSAEVEAAIKERTANKETFLSTIFDRVNDRFKDSYLKVYVEGRVKHLYSVYRKMFSQNKTIDEIYDLYAIRIIVDNMNECYNVLGVIHDEYKPIPGRFKDYISMPKNNMYQSLHTTVIGKEGVPFEVQIRTWDMHRTAEYGIAAHWKYKEGVGGKQNKSASSFESKLEWVNRLLEVQNNAADPEDFMRTFKVDFFADEVFVFTPKGDLINLPAGANVIDFAYAIHSAVGNRMIGAKVSGKIVPFEYAVSNGEIVEIITTKEPRGPSRDWLKIAKTSEAKNKIKQWFKKECREENIEKGREALFAEMDREGIRLDEQKVEEIIQTTAKRIGITGAEELYAAIGYGGVSTGRVIPKLRDEYLKQKKLASPDALPKIVEPRKAKSGGKGGVIVEGVENCLIKFARCCNPLPGDDIIGYITKGYGISVHRTDCSNVKSSLKRGDENERWLRVSWSGSAGEVFSSSLKIVCDKRVGLLADITVALANLRVLIHEINAREGEGGKLIVNVTIEVKDVTHIQNVMERLKMIKNVISITRGDG